MKQWDVNDNYTQDSYVRFEKDLGCSHDEATGFKKLVSFRVKLELRENYNNNNNNNNIYLLQLGCYPVAVVILHVYKI